MIFPVAEARNEYTYSASGTKLKVVQKWNPNFSVSPVIGSDITVTSLTKTKTTDYVGNIIYESHSDGTSKTRILVDGGYIDGGVYYFYLTDHLGNNRVVANASGTVIQKNHYYPFGMAFAETPLAEQKLQPYKYNNKEFDQMHGLNWYDYSARYYDATLPILPTMDPHSENYYSISPYAYVANNPMKYIDPTGMDYWSTNDPEEIKRLWAVLSSNGLSNSGTITLGENFNTSSWTHVSDNDFVAGLSFNDETQTFFTSYGSKEGDDYVVNGIFISATSFDGNSAYVESDLSQWYKKLLVE